MTEYPDESCPQPASKKGNETIHSHGSVSMLRRRDAAHELALSIRTLDRLTACNALPHYRVGKRVLFHAGELLAWVLNGAPTDPGAAVAVRREWRKAVAS